MENIKNLLDNTTTAEPYKCYEKTKAYQYSSNVLSQIIEKHGAEVFDEINRIV
ncbi:hypothetical protein CLNEO_24530 [Anaerotignum neopropionicum]|uniref:Uncharacterized protein n=1 Tax=Anaerotignum neopropionicum TaxID=36847 RepID=A0A136WC83_9FIRM|nr:hypothetical protein [Anaerotignum neopropionicum]KXL52104.1 hypothetical protein CLNEO_24530 [Anaerotignum neopropionicum]